MTSCLACTRILRDCPENCLLAKHINSVELMQTVEGHFGSLHNFIRLVETGAPNREKAAQTLVHEATCRKKDPVLGVIGFSRRAVAPLKSAYLALKQPATSPLAKKPRLDEGSSSITDIDEFIAAFGDPNKFVENITEKEIWDIIYEDNPSLRIPNQENLSQQ